MELDERMYAYTVYLRGREIDTLFYNSPMDVEEVKRDLINHDGYDSNIEVMMEKGEDKEFTLQEEVEIPGTDIVLEKGDKLKIIPKK
jgi:hypothetical protein